MIQPAEMAAKRDPKSPSRTDWGLSGALSGADNKRTRLGGRRVSRGRNKLLH
jgi:hypothetical protein